VAVRFRPPLRSLPHDQGLNMPKLLQQGAPFPVFTGPPRRSALIFAALHASPAKGGRQPGTCAR